MFRLEQLPDQQYILIIAIWIIIDYLLIGYYLKHEKLRIKINDFLLNFILGLLKQLLSNEWVIFINFSQAYFDHIRQ